MAKSFLLGYEGGFYIGDAPFDQRPGGSGSADYTNTTWTEMDIVIDVNNNFASESVDTTTRGEAKVGFSSEVNTTKTGEITTSIRWAPGDNQFDKMVKAWRDTEEIAVLDLDQLYTVVGAQGLASNMTVSFNITKPVKDIQRVDVTFKISSFPDWIYSIDGTVPNFSTTAPT